MPTLYSGCLLYTFATQLINKGGIVDQTFSKEKETIACNFWHKRCWMLMSKQVAIKQCGVDYPNFLLNYYYYDDVILILDAIESYFRDMISFSTSLMMWKRIMKSKTGPMKLDPQDTIMHLLVMDFLMCGSYLLLHSDHVHWLWSHAAVNFGQFKIVGYAP